MTKELRRESEQILNAGGEPQSLMEALCWNFVISVKSTEQEIQQLKTAVYRQAQKTGRRGPEQIQKCAASRTVPSDSMPTYQISAAFDPTPAGEVTDQPVMSPEIS